LSASRFAFGENWSRFLSELDEGRIALAEESLRKLLECERLDGRTFLDVGSGSGLFSLAARRLGATVRSFDYDSQSVACTQELKRRYFPDDPSWTVEHGSVLDEQYLRGLGEFDVVYAWGVLHHTGAMWQALENVRGLVRGGGQLAVAIYNDQGPASRRWLKVKQLYNRLPPPLRWLVLAPALLRLWGPTTVRDLVRGRPFATWRNYAAESTRGMSAWRDVVDWVGGLPFEVARPEQILEFCRDRGLVLRQLKTCGGGHGCNEFVFQAAIGPCNAAPLH
jgi:2-polyprenyl-6-hydroxyphenyl methylase/3-demethylubiquinone-9 3-methyltransferase